MLESTFQLTSGVGRTLERRLWREGISSWGELAGATPKKLPAPTERALRTAIDVATTALSARDVERLAELLPSREHWRLFAAFGEDAAYLDIETGDDVVGFEGISAIGVLDRHGPHFLLGGRDVADFPRLARGWSMLVTFNGLSYDVPILRRAFPEWEPPRCHVDLRHALVRLGQGGGLKAIEQRVSALHLARPAHLAGLAGWDVCSLYRRGRDGDRDALRRFAEYNLYDAVNLRTLMAHAYNELVLVETAGAPAVRAASPVVDVPGRGDVLYDVSKILLAL